MTVVVVEILGEHSLELTPVEDQDPVEALPTDRAHEALCERVGSRCFTGVRKMRILWAPRTSSVCFDLDFSCVDVTAKMVRGPLGD